MQSCNPKKLGSVANEVAPRELVVDATIKLLKIFSPKKSCRNAASIQISKE